MTPYRTPDPRVTQRTKAQTRRRMRVRDRRDLARIASGGDPDAVAWTVPREAGDRWNWD